MFVCNRDPPTLVISNIRSPFFFLAVDCRKLQKLKEERHFSSVCSEYERAAMIERN